MNHVTPGAVFSQRCTTPSVAQAKQRVVTASIPQFRLLRNNAACLGHRLAFRRCQCTSGVSKDGDVRVFQLTEASSGDTSDKDGHIDGALDDANITVASLASAAAGSIAPRDAVTPAAVPSPALDVPAGVPPSSSHDDADFGLYKNNLQTIMALAFPLMIQNVFGYLMSVISIAAIGRIGAPELAAASLATSIYTVTGHSLVLGLSSAMETLCGQAYGARDYKALGYVLQRAVLVCWTACIPVALLWLNSSSLMVAMGQDPEISKMAGRYLALCIPCIFLDIATDCMKKYLQAQSVVAPAMYATTVATLLSPAFFYVIVHHLGMGLDGAALALIMCHLTPLAGVLGYLVWHTRQAAGKPKATWGGFSAKAAGSKWLEYLKYGLPAMLMISLDWWVYEVAVLMTGYLPNAQAALSVGGICVSLNTWVYMVPVGLSSAVNTCVSNSLGSGDGMAAKRCAITGLACAVVVQSLVVCSVLAFGQQLIQLIATDPAVVVLAMRTLPVLCLLMFWDGINVVMSGVLRGSGQQSLGAQISGGTFLVAVCACFVFAFETPVRLLEALPALAALEPVARVWLGVALAVMTQTVVLLGIISRWDWNQQAERVLRSMILDGPGVIVTPGMNGAGPMLAH